MILLVVKTFKKCDEKKKVACSLGSSYGNGFSAIGVNELIGWWESEFSKEKLKSTRSDSVFEFLIWSSEIICALAESSKVFREV